MSPATGQESFGIVLLEAMASGTPIVCSDIHGYRGVVRRGEQALLVPPRDVNALTDALAQLLGDPRCASGWVNPARQRAVQFGWDNITAKVEEYYLSWPAAPLPRDTCRRIPTRRSSPVHASRRRSTRSSRRADAQPV